MSLTFHCAPPGLAVTEDTTDTTIFLSAVIYHDSTLGCNNPRLMAEGGIYCTDQIIWAMVAWGLAMT